MDDAFTEAENGIVVDAVADLFRFEERVDVCISSEA